MYNELLFEIWEQDKINKKGKTTVTNFDKVKELITLDKINLDMSEIDICSIIHTVKKEQTCIDRNCTECYKWLKSEYKEQVLTDKEREYLSAVIKPFKDKVINITKLINDDDLEFIEIVLNDNTYAMLPAFNKNTMYKDMVYGKEYDLEELGL